jgi:nucleoside-diphosphate-sugar epimerase
MIRVFISGATGFIGLNLVRELINRGYHVHALVRSGSEVSLLQNDNIDLFTGDITDLNSIEKAMDGCKYAFHLAAYAKIWPGQKDVFEQINFLGTILVVESAIKNKIERIILTSTAGVFGPSDREEDITEHSFRSIGYFNNYEETKDITDRYVLHYYKTKIHLAVVCPTRVYGPGLLNDSNSVTRLIKSYMGRKNIFIPGNGESIGNYVYIDDVVSGLLLTLEKAKSGERYILGGENASFNELFDHIGKISRKKFRRFRVPARLIHFFAYVFLGLGKLKIIKPPITPSWTKRYFYHWNISCEKARNDLGYEPVSLETGLKRTIKWLSDEGNS